MEKKVKLYNIAIWILTFAMLMGGPTVFASTTAEKFYIAILSCIAIGSFFIVTFILAKRGHPFLIRTSGWSNLIFGLFLIGLAVWGYPKYQCFKKFDEATTPEERRAINCL